MLLCVDIGNTETTIGIFEGKKLARTFRLETKVSETADEVAVDITSLLSLAGKDFRDLDGVCLCSVVPRSTQAYLEMVERYLGLKPLIVGPGIKTGIAIIYDNPQEIGADRITNAVGCFEKYGAPGIVVDFGTATTLDVISENGEYIGGTISPGLIISSEALFLKAARLSKVDLVAPKRTIGKNTRESLQSGIIFGTAGMVDSLVRRIKRELRGKPVVVATGGLCEIFSGISEEIEFFDPHLTLHGLRIIYWKNF